MASGGAEQADVAVQIAALQQQLNSKRTFCDACRGLAKLCEDGVVSPGCGETAMADAAARTFTVLQTRHTEPRFWQAGLDLFLVVDFHLPSIAKAVWRERAFEELDDEARERARADAQRRKEEQERARERGPSDEFGAGMSRAQLQELLEASGMFADVGRPPMARSARTELRLVTVERATQCSICQEELPVGSKAKTMPCKHLFHDDCILEWVSKHNSCPECRFDELPSEKLSYDEEVRHIQQKPAARTGMFS